MVETLEGVLTEDLLDDIDDIIDGDPDITESEILDELTDRWDISYEAAAEAMQAYNERDEEEFDDEEDDYYDDED